MKYRVIYVDIDGTLLFWPGKSKGTPPKKNEEGYGLKPEVNRPLVAALKAWHKDKRFLAFWSRGGAEHCRNTAKLCGLSPDACLPKPYACFDDAPRSVTAGDRKGFLVIDPNSFHW